MANKVWVFQKLVTNHNDDPIGMIAYAIYKKNKNKIAIDLREEGCSEEEISEKLRTYHETIASCDNTCDLLRDSALKVIEQATVKPVEDMQAQLNKQYATKLSELEKQEAELKKAKDIFEKDELKIRNRLRQEELKKIGSAAQEQTKQNKIVRSFLWLWNGCASLIAATIIVVTFYGVLAVTSNDQVFKKQLSKEFSEWLTTTLTTTPLPDLKQPPKTVQQN